MLRKNCTQVPLIVLYVIVLISGVANYPLSAWELICLYSLFSVGMKVSGTIEPVIATCVYDMLS